MGEDGTTTQWVNVTSAYLHELYTEIAVLRAQTGAQLEIIEALMDQAVDAKKRPRR
jgi:hypothetical protein